MEDVRFSLNKFAYPDRLSGRYVYRVVVDPENPLTALSYVCDSVDVCDLSNPDAPCFIEEGDCRAWGDYQDLLNNSGNGGGGGGGGDGGGGGSSSGSGGGCSAPQCPCPGPAPVCGSGDGCCCGVNQFCGGSSLNSGVWSCGGCYCVPGTVFGVGGGCVNPWGAGGYDGIGA